MDKLFTFAKENYELVTLLVGLLGVIVSCVAVVHELRTRKRKKQQNSTDETSAI